MESSIPYPRSTNPSAATHMPRFAGLNVPGVSNTIMFATCIPHASWISYVGFQFASLLGHEALKIRSINLREVEEFSIGRPVKGDGRSVGLCV